MKIEIIFSDSRTMTVVDALVFNGKITLASDRVIVEPGKTTLENVKFDGEESDIIFGELTFVKVPEGLLECPEIAKIILTYSEGLLSGEVLNSALSRYQYREFCGKRITQKEYEEIAREVRLNDKRECFLNIVCSIGTKDEELMKDIQYLQENPTDEFVEYVMDYLEERVTGEDEFEAIKALVQRYRNEIRK